VLEWIDVVISKVQFGGPGLFGGIIPWNGWNARVIGSVVDVLRAELDVLRGEGSSAVRVSSPMGRLQECRFMDLVHVAGWWSIERLALISRGGPAPGRTVGSITISVSAEHNVGACLTVEEG